MHADLRRCSKMVPSSTLSMRASARGTEPHWGHGKRFQWGRLEWGFVSSIRCITTRHDARSSSEERVYVERLSVLIYLLEGASGFSDQVNVCAV